MPEVVQTETAFCNDERFPKKGLAVLPFGGDEACLGA